MEGTRGGGGRTKGEGREEARASNRTIIPRRSTSMQPTVSVHRSAIMGGRKRERHTQIAVAASSKLNSPKRGMT
jgi:hypothetical protein